MGRCLIGCILSSCDMKRAGVGWDMTLQEYEGTLVDLVHDVSADRRRGGAKVVCQWAKEVRDFPRLLGGGRDIHGNKRTRCPSLSEYDQEPM